MILKRFLAPALVTLALALPAQAQEISLSRLSAYLNALDEAQTDFTQINSDGTISTGIIKISRPGRMRFEYNAPDETLVLAAAQRIAIFDAKSNTSAEQYPLDMTPLKLILGQNINLAATGMVVDHSYDGTATSVTAQDPEHPELGTIQLVFTDDPIELRQWVVTDNMGAQTIVILGALDQDVSFSTSDFSIDREISRRQSD